MRIIHLFQWNIKDILQELPQIKSQGFTHIQLQPKQSIKNNCNDWWLFYQPLGLKICEDYTGTLNEYKNLIQEAHRYGLKVIQDIVIRHVATDDYNCNIPHQKVNKNLLPFIIKTDYCSNWEDRKELTEKNTGMPMIEYDNHDYLILVKNFLDELVNYGVDMFRLDQAKHFKTRDEGGQLIKLLSNYNVYGECIDCDSKTLDQYTKDIMVGINNCYWNKEKSVAWWESHDTFLNDNDMGYTRNVSEFLIANEYTILCKNYPNTLFYVRPFSQLWKSDLVRMANKF